MLFLGIYGVNSEVVLVLFRQKQKMMRIMRRPSCVKPGDDPDIVCRRGLINTLTLRKPIPKERIIFFAWRDHGFTRRQVLAAARWFNLAEEVRGGEVYWVKPPVLAVLNGWHYGGPRQRGNAA